MRGCIVFNNNCRTKIFEGNCHVREKTRKPIFTNPFHQRPHLLPPGRLCGEPYDRLQKSGTITLFAFDIGEGLSEHTAPYDAIATIIDGEAEISIEHEQFVSKKVR